MVVNDQAAVIAFLGNPESHPGAPAVERLDTHTASVFLVGNRAYKLKRAVRYDYLDYSTLELRRAACEAEVRLNRRTAPQLYLGVIPVTREADGRVTFEGQGDVLDWVVVMERFPQDQMLDRLAESRRLSVDTVLRLADHIADFHQNAERRRDHGGAGAIARVIDGNREALEAAGDVLDPALVRRVDLRTRELLAAHTRLLDDRRASGMVRQCHGDLHLRNIVLLNGEPTLFDAIEFNDDFAVIDVMYDLSFLLMDLLARDLDRHASAVFNRYLLRTADYAGVALLPLFLSCRAVIRCKTSLSAASLSEDSTRAAELHERARRYLALAARLIERVTPWVIAIGGYSGTGKSTLALRLAPTLQPPPGAVVLRSDEIRRELFGIPPGQPAPEDVYTPANRRSVYQRMMDYAATVAGAGYPVILDAVFADDEERLAARALARNGVPFMGLWLHAEPSVLERRLIERRGDVSDADVDVMRRQVAEIAPPADWHIVDASRTIEEIEASARAVINDAPVAGKYDARRT
jgi:aminoglycoside phosphotransferase family enzyme/predicted kinase